MANTRGAGKRTTRAVTKKTVTTPRKANKTRKAAEPKKSKKVEVDDAALNEVEIDSLLDKIKVTFLKELLEGNSQKLPKSATKKRCVDAILSLARSKGQREFLDILDKDTLRSAAQDVEGKTDLGHDSKTKMHKTIKESIEDKGFDGFLSSVSMNVLKDFCKSLGFEEEGKKDAVEVALKEEVLILGLKDMFDQMQKSFMNDVAKDLNIKVSGTKAALINRILSSSFPHLLDEETEKKEEKKRETKQKNAPPKVDIKKGVTKDELYQLYTDGLLDYCKKNGLKKSGNKKEVIVRILKFLDGDTETTKPLKPGQTHKRKRLAKSKGKSTTETKKTTGKRKATDKAEGEKTTKKSK